MKTSKRILSVAVIGTLSAALCQLALADTVRFYNWESYTAETVFEQFAERTGHQVSEIYYDEEDVRDAVISSGRATNYDVILMDTFSLLSLQNGSNFHDTTQIPLENRKYIGKKWQNACGKFGIPYAHGTLGIAYRDSINKTPINSWNQIFDPSAEHVGKVAMLLDSVDSVAVALLASGNKPFSENEAELKDAYAKLVAQKSKVATYEYAVSYAIANGPSTDISLAMVYSTDMWSLMEYSEQEDWQYVIPDEGTTEWVDCLALPISHPISEATIQFLDFLNEPEIAIENAEEVWISTTNDGALALASEDYLGDESLFPPAEVMAKSESYRALSSAALNFRKRMLVGVANQQ